MASSLEDVRVSPMPETQEFLDDYVAKVKKLLAENKIPDLNQKLTYKVYRLKGSSFGAHESVVLGHGGKFFTMELGFITVDGEKHIYPVTRPYTGPKEKLEYCGEVTKTGNELLSRGVQLMQKFGTYYKCLNNCQNYCNAYLCDIGLGDKKKLTDGEKGFLMGAGATVAIGIGLLILNMLRGSSRRQ